MYRLLLLSLIACWLLPACSHKKNTPAKPPAVHNIIVLLDLSDRVMDGKQQERDKALLAAVLAAFEQKARTQQYIHCNDRLQVLALPQKSSLPGIEDMEKLLRLDFSKLALKEKSAYLKQRNPAFTAAIDSLYAMASRGARSSDYAGSDTWQFFNQYLPHYISTDTLVQNRVIVITDGYLDFESLEHKKQEGCRYSYSSAFMQQARKMGDGWKDAFRERCGLLPVTLPATYNTHILALELHPRNSFTHEGMLLLELWDDWTYKMNVKTSQVALQSSIADEEKEIAKFLD